MLQILIEDGEQIPEPGDNDDDDIDWESICPG